MTERWYSVYLRSDVIISTDMSTASGHSTLDYIPGSTLLGAVARFLYNSDGIDSDIVFHSGKIRFLPAYPVVGKHKSFPVPFTYLEAKGAKTENIAAVKNDLFFQPGSDGVIRKQIRSKYISGAGNIASVKKQMKLKTAIDRSSGGRSRDGQLFGYESIEAGQTFVFSIQADDDAGQYLDKIESALIREPIRFGRSKRAEYGSVEIKKIETNFESIPQFQNSEQLFVYCYTDLCLRDPDTAQISADPAVLLKLVGLAGSVSVSYEKSRIRTRTYAPFNAHRSRFSRDITVIEKGSVIVYESKDSSGAQTLLDAIQKPIGAYRETGLGQLIANPLFLKGPQPEFSFWQAKVQKQEPNAVETRSESDLLGWLRGQQKLWQATEKGKQLAAEFIQDFGNIAITKRNTPTSSQWAQLRHIGQEQLKTEKADQYENAFKKLTESGVSGKAWNIELRDEQAGKWISIHDRLKHDLEAAAKAGSKVVAYMLIEIGRAMPHKIKQLSAQNKKEKSGAAS